MLVALTLLNGSIAYRTTEFAWTHFSYDWHHTVNQCLPKLLSTFNYDPHASQFLIACRLASFLWNCALQWCFCLTENEECQRKFDIGKCVFNFLRFFFFSSSVLSLDACISLVRQTSSQSNIILFTICFLPGHSSHYDEKRRIQWNGTTWWKLDEKEQAQIFGCSKQRQRWQEHSRKKKLTNLKLIIYHVESSHTDGAALWTAKKKTYFSINQMHHDPIWLDPQLRRKPNYNRIDIVLFPVGFLCFTHSNGKWQSVRISWGLRSMGKFHRNKNQKTQLKAFNMNGFCVHSKKIAFVFDATKSKIALQFSIAATSSIGSGRLITWHRTRLHMSKLLLQFSVGRISPGSSNNDVNKMLNNRKVT